MAGMLRKNESQLRYGATRIGKYVGVTKAHRKRILSYNRKKTFIPTAIKMVRCTRQDCEGRH